MKLAPNLKKQPRDRLTEIIIFAGSDAWSHAKEWQEWAGKHIAADDVPPVVLADEQLKNITDYTMTGEAFDPVEVDMGRSAANNITQSGGTEWSKRDKSTYDPTDDIEAYALNASGVVNIIVFDPKGWALFRSFKAVREKLDTRRGSHSELETAVKDLGKAVSYKGMYGDVAIVVYSGQYVENGVKKNFLPDNTMVLGNTHARGLRTYGCIQDADALSEGINASPRYPKNWKTSGDPAREFTMIQSAPLMLLADPDEFVSVQLA